MVERHLLISSYHTFRTLFSQLLTSVAFSETLLIHPITWFFIAAYYPIFSASPNAPQQDTDWFCYVDLDADGCVVESFWWIPCILGLLFGHDGCCLVIWLEFHNVIWWPIHLWEPGGACLWSHEVVIVCSSNDWGTNAFREWNVSLLISHGRGQGLNELPWFVSMIGPGVGGTYSAGQVSTTGETTKATGSSVRCWSCVLGGHFARYCY